MTYEELSKDFMSKAYNGEINRDVAMTVVRICTLVECATNVEPIKYEITNNEDVHIHWEIGMMKVFKAVVLSPEGYGEYSSAAKYMGMLLLLHPVANAKPEGETLQ